MLDTRIPRALPSLEDMTARLDIIRASASAAQIADGRSWYYRNGRMIRLVAAAARNATGDHSLTNDHAAAVFAAFSQNATWKANVTMATNYLMGRGQNGLDNVMTELAAMEEGADPTVILMGKSGQSKRPDFYRNLIGRHTYVTCDRWHITAACGRTFDLLPSVRERITVATRAVAAKYGETPMQCQAVVWCVMRGDGN